MKAPIQDMIKYFNEKKLKEITSFYTPVEIIKELGFRKTVIISYWLMYNWDDFLNDYSFELQEFAVILLYVLKGKCPDEWNTCWKYDALLGRACDIIMDYDSRYEAYKCAYEKAIPPPPALLIALADCCICPGPPPVSYDEAIKLLERAISEYPYLDALSLLSAVYAHKNDEEKRSYWSRLRERLVNQGGQNAPSIEPSFICDLDQTL